MSLLSKRLQTSQTSDALSQLSLQSEQLPLISAAGATALQPDLGAPEDSSLNSLGMRLARIPAGEFWMGHHESAADLASAFPDYEPDRLAALFDEQPLHRVRITRPFCLGVHAVTIGQFKQFIAESAYQTQAERDGEGGWGYNPAIAYFEGRKPEYSWRNPGFSQDDRHPVLNVTWNDALAFCHWLSDKEGRNYRLPTEAQWEYACRAGTTTRYHCGDRPEELVRVANLYDAATRSLFPQWSKFAVAGNDGHTFTAPVGSYEPNAWGLYDMHGNVWEWCADWYELDYYRQSPLDDPAGPESGAVRVRRGGSWHTWPLYLRSSYRNWNTPDTRYVLLGFRIALDAGPGDQ